MGRTFASLEDPSIVFFEGRYHVFASVDETTAGVAGYESVYLSFSDFSPADTAVQTYMPELSTGSTVALQVFYFEAHGSSATKRTATCSFRETMACCQIQDADRQLAENPFAGAANVVFDGEPWSDDVSQ